MEQKNKETSVVSVKLKSYFGLGRVNPLITNQLITGFLSVIATTISLSNQNCYRWLIILEIEIKLSLFCHVRSKTSEYFIFAQKPQHYNDS